MNQLLLHADAANERVDQFLARSLDGFSRAAVQRLLLNHLVLLNGVPVKKNDRLHLNDTLLVSIPDPQPLQVLPQKIPLDIIFEDADLLVVNKPAGMVVHPAPGHPDGTLVNALLAHCGDSLSGINGVLRPGIVHRIDRDTSGLLVVAKNDRAHHALAAQLQDHSLARSYHAVAVGNFPSDSGSVNVPIARHPTERTKMAPSLNGKPAVTHWLVLERFRQYTYLQCDLETGRTHQIRVHMAYLHHPLLGDTVYGNKKPYPGLPGQCLHAKKIRFVHPSTGDLLQFSCPLPDHFIRVLHALRAAQLH